MSSGLPTVQDDFGQYDIIDLRIAMMEPHPRGFRDDDPAVRLVSALKSEIERLQTLVGQHDPTGADHMEQMWKHAQRADAAEEGFKRLQRRCEIYAAGLRAIADPLPGSTEGVLIRTAINTLRRVEQEGT